MATTATGAIAIWADPGDQLLGRAVEHALRVRLPTWRVFGLFPEGPVARGCLRPLLAGVTVTVVCGGDPELDAGSPVLLCGVRNPAPALAARASLVSVRDPASRDSLREAGITAEVIPHPGLLSARLLDPDDVPLRVRHLRRLGVLPESGDYVIAPGPAEVIAGVAVVPEPAGLALEDWLAALASARAVVATGEHTAAAAAGLGVPWALVDPDVTSIVEEAALEVSQVDSQTALLDKHFDDVAAAAERALGSGSPPVADVLAAENAALRAAHLRQRQRILLERERLIDPMAGVWRERDAARAEVDRFRAERDRFRTEHAAMAARLAEVERELAAWQNTKLVRWTRPLRGLYARLRAR